MYLSHTPVIPPWVYLSHSGYTTLGIPLNHTLHCWIYLSTTRFTVGFTSQDHRFIPGFASQDHRFIPGYASPITLFTVEHASLTTRFTVGLGRRVLGREATYLPTMGNPPTTLYICLPGYVCR